MREERGSWYLLTALVLGIGFGLLYSWVLSPVRYVNTAPNSLRDEFKDRYRALIAAAYQANGDIGRARSRLELLGDADMVGALTLQAQRAIAEGRPDAEIQALTRLMLSLSSGGTPPPTPTPTAITPTTASISTPTISPTPVVAWTDTPMAEAGTPRATFTVLASKSISPTITATATPTSTPTPTAGAPLALKERQKICKPPVAEPLLQVETLDAAGNPVPGVEIIVQWSGGEEHFFTGLKPEVSLGYADFVMTPGVTYLLQLGDGGQPVSDLTALECESASGDRTWGAWKLTFVQP